jgi:hypothetical protein
VGTEEDVVSPSSEELLRSDRFQRISELCSGAETLAFLRELFCPARSVVTKRQGTVNPLAANSV